MGQQIAVRVVGVGVGLAQAAVRRDVAVLVIGVGAGVTVVGVGFGVVGQRAGGVVLQGGRAAGQLVVIHDLRRQRDGNAGQGFQPGGLCARVRAEAGGGGQVGLRGVGVAHVHIEVRAGQVDVGVFGAQFVNNIGQVRRSGGAVAQLHIRLCAAPVGGFAAVVHPDGAAEHRDSLGVFAVRQVFFTHRQRPFHPRPGGEDKEEHTEGQQDKDYGDDGKRVDFTFLGSGGHGGTAPFEGDLYDKWVVGGWLRAAYMPPLQCDDDSIVR